MNSGTDKSASRDDSAIERVPGASECLSRDVRPEVMIASAIFIATHYLVSSAERLFRTYRSK